MTAVKTKSTFVIIQDDHGFKGGADVDCPCLHIVYGICRREHRLSDKFLACRQYHLDGSVQMIFLTGLSTYE